MRGGDERFGLCVCASVRLEYKCSCLCLQFVLGVESHKQPDGELPVLHRYPDDPDDQDDRDDRDDNDVILLDEKQKVYAVCFYVGG